MRTALALATATFSRSLTARVATALLLVLPSLLSVGLVAAARGADADSPSAAKLGPYREGTFGEAAASLSGQVIAALALIVVGFAVAWLVGREWADHTIGSLFSLPVARAAIARSKLAVIAIWAASCITLAMVLVAGGIALVDAASLDAAVMSHLIKVWFAGLATAALALPFAWVAVAFRGYLGALGAIIGVTAFSQILASLGLGSWIPYVAPALWAGAGGADAAASVGPGSFLIVSAFVALGTFASVRAFSRARLD